MCTTGASGADAWTATTMVPSGAESIRYQTVASTRPHFETCGSSRSTVASTVVPCATAGNVGRSTGLALLSFGGGSALAGDASTPATTSAVSRDFTVFIQSENLTFGNACQDPHEQGIGHVSRRKHRS